MQVYNWHEVNKAFTKAAKSYTRATQQNDGLALLVYTREVVKLAKLTGERLAEVEAKVIAVADKAVNA